MSVDHIARAEAEETPSLAEEAAPSEAIVPALTAPRAARSFAGFRLPTLGLVGVILALLVWNAWTTREVIALKQHRIVSVSLASLITEFVQTQARKSASQDEAAFRTRLYLMATQKALTDLARNGTPVLVSEAVLGNSVPDDTAQVKVAVAKAMTAQSGRH